MIITHTGDIALEAVIMSRSLSTPARRYEAGDEVELPVEEALRLRQLGLAKRARMIVNHHEILEREWTTGFDFPFPEPWFPRQMIGGYELVPITTSADLYAESYFMEHCVGGNSRLVSEGHQYMFSIRQFGGRVATLMLGRVAPYISDVRGYRDASVPEVRAAIVAWLAEQPGKILPLME